MPKRRKIPPQKPLVAFENKVRRFVRKTPEYIALLDLGMVDISERFWKGELLHYKEESSIVFETCIRKNNPIDAPLLVYHIYGKSVSSTHDWTNHWSTRYRYPRGYTKLFYKIANGIIYGMKRLHTMYLIRLHEGGHDETEFIISMKRHELPLHINRKWESNVNKKIYLNRMKTRNTAMEAEIA